MLRIQLSLATLASALVFSATCYGAEGRISRYHCKEFATTGPRALRVELNLQTNWVEITDELPTLGKFKTSGPAVKVHYQKNGQTELNFPPYYVLTIVQETAGGEHLYVNYRAGQAFTCEPDEGR